jgi:divalent metal cation (Fe/Co/Zn/Cd) transporter
VESSHIVRLRKSGPIFQGEMEIEVKENMTIKEFNNIKINIKNRIKEIFPEIERVTITAITKK